MSLEVMNKGVAYREIPVPENNQFSGGTVFFWRTGNEVICSMSFQTKGYVGWKNMIEIPDGFKAQQGPGASTVLGSSSVAGLFGTIYTSNNNLQVLTQPGAAAGNYKGTLCWYTVDAFPDFAGGGVSSYFGSSLKTFKESIRTDTFNIGFVTDAHYDYGTWRKNANLSMRNLNNVLSLSDCLNAAIIGGDNVDSEKPNVQANEQNLYQYCSSFFFDSNMDKFGLRGNHEQGSLIPFNKNGKVMPGDIVSDDMLKRALRTADHCFGEVRNGDSFYGYKDYPESQIRLIFVDTNDNPTILNSDGSLKYFAQWDYGYQEEQLQWVANQALGTCPDDYHAIIFSHIPLNLTADVSRERRRNFDCMTNIVNAFINKSTASITSVLPDFEVDFEVDFTNRENSVFVGWFGGHEHRENIDDMGAFKAVSCDCAYPRNQVDVGTPAEDAFTVIQIDTANRCVDMLGFGRATNRSFIY